MIEKLQAFALGITGFIIGGLIPKIAKSLGDTGSWSGDWDNWVSD